MQIITGITALIISVVLHELMHGVVADRLGDSTARLLGRITLNPIKHLDPIYSVLVPLLLIISGVGIIFGAAKPVPVNPIHFKDPKKDMALVALAGPVTNFVLALVAALLFHLFFQNISLTQVPVASNPLQELLFFFLLSMITINLILAFLNLIPIPPLDGSKIVSAFLPHHLAASYQSIGSFGIFILLALFFIPGPFSLGIFLEKLLVTSLSLLGLT